MIRLTRLSHTPVVVNADLIEHIEITPDTVISMTSGQKIVVLETSEEVIARIIDYRRSVLRGSLRCPWMPAAGIPTIEDSR